MKLQNKYINYLPIQSIDKYLAKKSDTKKSIFIAGTMRSGTTFLQEMLESIVKYRLIFEPLSYRAKIFNEFHYNYYYNTEKKTTEFNPSFTDFIINNDVFKNKLELCIKGYYSNDYLRRNRRYFFTPNTIVKSVRSNLILDYIYKNLTKNVIFLIRNPLDIWKSLSYMENTRNILVHSEYSRMYKESGLFNQFPELNNLFKMKFPERFSEFRNFLIVWIIQNYIPLKQNESVNSFNPHVILYKDLLITPFNTINDILTFIDFPKVSEEKVLKLTTIKSSTVKNKNTEIEEKFLNNKILYSNLMYEFIELLPPLKKEIQSMLE